MDNKLDMGSITNGLLALQQLRQLYSPQQADGAYADSGQIHGGNRGPIRPDRISLLRDTLSTISELFPAARSNSLLRAIDLSRQYSGTYRDVKLQFGDIKKNGADRAKVMKTVRLMNPLLGNRQRLYTDKVLKILEILEV